MDSVNPFRGSPSYSPSLKKKCDVHSHMGVSNVKKCLCGSDGTTNGGTAATGAEKATRLVVNASASEVVGMILGRRLRVPLACDRCVGSSIINVDEDETGGRIGKQSIRCAGRTAQSTVAVPGCSRQGSRSSGGGDVANSEVVCRCDWCGSIVMHDPNCQVIVMRDTWQSSLIRLLTWHVRKACC